MSLATLALAVRFLLEQQKRTGDNQAHDKADDLIVQLDAEDLDAESQSRGDRAKELFASASQRLSVKSEPSA